MDNTKLINWNTNLMNSWKIRGIGNKGKGIVIKKIYKKIFDNRSLRSIWGVRFEDWVFLPSKGRSGGIL